MQILWGEKKTAFEWVWGGDWKNPYPIEFWREDRGCRDNGERTRVGTRRRQLQPSQGRERESRRRLERDRRREKYEIVVKSTDFRIRRDSRRARVRRTPCTGALGCGGVSVETAARNPITDPINLYAPQDRCARRGPVFGSVSLAPKVMRYCTSFRSQLFYFYFFSASFSRRLRRTLLPRGFPLPHTISLQLFSRRAHTYVARVEYACRIRAGAHGARFGVPERAGTRETFNKTDAGDQYVLSRS